MSTRCYRTTEKCCHLGPKESRCLRKDSAITNSDVSMSQVVVDVTNIEIAPEKMLLLQLV